MNPIYLETRFKRDGENDPAFDELESLPSEFAIITAYATTGEEWSDAKKVNQQDMCFNFPNNLVTTLQVYKDSGGVQRPCL